MCNNRIIRLIIYLNYLGDPFSDYFNKKNYETLQFTFIYILYINYKRESNNHRQY
jgi:hypothetical protein